MLPKNWELKKIENITHKVGSGVTPTGGESVYLRAGAPFIRSQNVGWGVLLLENLYYLSDEIHGKMSSTILKKNDVLLNITGASIGRSAIVDDRIVGGNVNQHVCIIRPKTEIVNPFYLNQFLLSSMGQNLIDSYQSGGNRQGLNLEQIKSFQVPIPPMPEQHYISEILNICDIGIENISKLIFKNENKKKALEQKLLTGNVRFEGFNDAEWEEVNISDYLKIKATYGIVTTGDFQPEGIKMIRGGDIKNGKVNTDLPKVTKEKNAEYKRTQLEKNDIVISLVGYPGQTAIIPENLIGSNISRAVGLIRVDERVDSKFLVQYLNSELGQRMILAPSAGSAQTVVNLSDLNKLRFPLPDIREQKKIAEILYDSDREIQTLKALRLKFKEQKKGLMQLLLTGKLRVKTK